MRVLRPASLLAAGAATLSMLGLGWAPAVPAQCPTPTFGPAATFLAAPGTLAPADYDVDGRPDVAVGGVVLYGDGAGGFTAPVGILGVRALAAADLGGVTPPIPGVNGLAPELVAESTVVPTRVVVGLGTGERATPFSGLAGFPAWGSPPRASVAADLTGDGLPDLVVAYGPPANVLAIWAGVAGGPNWQPTVAPVEIGLQDPVALSVGDFDADGRPELLAASGSGNGIFELRYVNGQFASMGVAVRGGPAALATADLDGDGLLDAVVATGSGDVVTLLGTGRVVGGQGFGDPFREAGRAPVGGGPSGIALGDLNGDRRLDAVVADRTGQRWVPLLGDGAGGFAPAQPQPTGTSAPTSVALADLDGDGALDVVAGDAADASVVVRRNTCVQPLVNVEITGLEATQGVQDAAGSVELVAGRQTFVRVHVRAGAAVDGVTARLTRTDAAGTPLEAPLLPANPGGRIRVKASPDRKLLQDAFLFELPPSWTAAGTLRLAVSVNPERQPAETTYADNLLSRTLDFRPTSPLKIELVRIRFTVAPGPGTSCGRAQEPTEGDLDEAESALRRKLPAGKIVVTRRADPWDSGLTLDCTINIALGVESQLLLDVFKAAFDAEPRDRIRVGIFRREPIGGVAEGIPGWFAVSQTSAPDTVVHEVGHTLGRRHVMSPSTPPCSASLAPAGTDPLYPYPGGAIGGPGADPERFIGFDPGDATGGQWPVPRRIVPPTSGDMMGYCRDRWPSDFTWTALRQSIDLRFPPNDPVGDFLAVSGALDPANGRVTRLSAVRRPRLGAIEPALPGAFRLRLLAAGGAVLTELPFSPRTDPDGRAIRIDETMGFVPGARRLALLDPRGVELGSLPVSARPPSVTRLSLSSGTGLPASGPVTVAWAASDADGDPIVADLLWSRDGGASFDPIASGVSGSSYRLDAGLLRGTGGRSSGVLRVLVRDPVLGAMAELSGLRAAGSAPRVRVVAPAAGQAFVRDQTISLRASATDAEDGPLDTAVRWSSHRDGALGTGATLPVRLSAGSHLLTATAVDSDGNVAAATTTVLVAGVLQPGGPPVADAGADAQAVEGATVTLDGSASSDPDGDALTHAWRLVQAPVGAGDVVLAGAGPHASFVPPDDGTYRLELVVSDPLQQTSTATVTVGVANVSPTVTIASPAPDGAFPAGPIGVDAIFADPGLLDVHACSVVWDEDRGKPPVPGLVSEPDRTCSATRTLGAGVYSVRVTVRDDDGGEGVARTRFAVVDPRAGSARGRGAFDSPRGALASNPAASGRTRFDFESSYGRRSSRPGGHALLRFGSFHFRTADQDWLVVAGTRAQVRGSGRVNGRPGYGYLLTAEDAGRRRGCGDGDDRDDRGGGDDARGGDRGHTGRPDRFRLKVWRLATGAVVYDNVPGAPDDLDVAAPQAAPDGCISVGKQRRDHD